MTSKTQVNPRSALRGPPVAARGDRSASRGHYREFVTLTMTLSG